MAMSTSSSNRRASTIWARTLYAQSLLLTLGTMMDAAAAEAAREDAPRLLKAFGGHAIVVPHAMRSRPHLCAQPVHAEHDKQAAAGCLLDARWRS